MGTLVQRTKGRKYCVRRHIVDQKKPVPKVGGMHSVASACFLALMSGFFRICIRYLLPSHSHRLIAAFSLSHAMVHFYHMGLSKPDIIWLVLQRRLVMAQSTWQHQQWPACQVGQWTMLVGASRQCPRQLTGRQLHQPLVCSAAQAAMAHSDRLSITAGSSSLRVNRLVTWSESTVQQDPYPLLRPSMCWHHIKATK